MKISDIKAHHIRIPYDAGVASFRQGASAIAALDMVLVEVLTDSGLTGWGDAFSYVCPRTTCAACLPSAFAPVTHELPGTTSGSTRKRTFQSRSCCGPM